MCMVLLPHVFLVWLTLRILTFVVDLVLVGSSNVSCAIVIYLSYCYGDQLSFAAFACLLRDPRHYTLKHSMTCSFASYNLVLSTNL